MNYAAAFNMLLKCCTSGVVPFQVGYCYELDAGFINFNDVSGDIRMVERLLKSGRQALGLSKLLPSICISLHLCP